MESLHAFFERHRSAAVPLVLATVIGTEGSTYRKAGAQMLIAPDGTAAGLLSGGCLESDVLERSQQVFASGLAQCVTYDTRGSDDAIWGIGLGCEGLMRILLQPLCAAQRHEPFTSLVRAETGDLPGVIAIAIDTNLAEVPLGTSIAFVANEVTHGEPTAALRAHCQAQGELIDAATFVQQMAGGEVHWLIKAAQHARRLLVCGAGPDVAPVVAMAGELGWRISVVDHRPAYVDRAHFPAALEVLEVDPSLLGRQLALERMDAAVVMSHHLTSDAAYLRALAHSPVRYVGLLGPAPRRARLLAELGDDARRLAGRLFGPVGLDIGARTPAGIALAIVAEVHAVLSGRPGAPYSRVP
jgi:xanthine/CO dehydrogenase XdhC/CoxF family maturation factor